MKQIIKDFKNWLNTSKEVRIIEQDTKNFKRCITQECDFGTWKHNTNMANRFYDVCASRSIFDELKKISDMVKYGFKSDDFVNKEAANYRATSCYYRYNEEEGCCINTREGNCEGCKKQKAFERYNELKQEIEKAKQKQIDAKQKFLNHFIFWNQK